MYYKSFFAAVMSAMMLVGCSSDDMPQAAPGADNSTSTGNSYVNISINLPTVNAGIARAGQENDQFDDGDQSEYAVTCAHLVVFKGATESGATISGVYPIDNLKPWNISGTTTDNITSTAQTVQQISETQADAAKGLWMMIVLNDPDALAHFTTDKTFNDLTTSANSTYSMRSEKGFYMVNAPLYNKGVPQTLVKLDATKIFNTAAEASAKPATDIYVERGVAKVTVSVASNLNIKDTDVKINVAKWGLGVTNTKTYLVRNISNYDKWAALTNSSRFYSATSNRIYWAVDPNYSEYSADFDNLNTLPDVDITEPAYCLENTFNVANMNQNQTTRVVFEATVGDGETFFTVGSSSKMYKDQDLVNLIISQAVACVDGKDSSDKYSVSLDDMKANAGVYELQISDVTYDGENLTGKEVAAINDAIGSIDTYKGGACYYVARIQHFGDTYTPWSVGDDTYGDVDPSGKYLGRYGVVRNNWYELSVTGVKALGTSTVPDPKTTTDDENESFINFSVNMHSWAKRVQELELK